MSSIPSPARDLAIGVGEHQFDGNLSDGVLHWWFIDGDDFEADDVEHSMKALLRETVEGCFSWVVFPIGGFRV